jgi:ligand-binding sensor domain-containing protein/signal transduction histidine kinase
MRWLPAVLFLLLSPLYIFSQEYGYTRYDSKDGLPSSTVYCMTQDKDGFMWFGTETGLSRFDGTHFKTFTQEDGLPDNEIIQLFADSKGRVWISPFKKTICYYYKGKIYNQKNDSLLKQIQVTNNVVRFAEDDRGNVLLMETNQLHLVMANDQVHAVKAIDGEPIKYLSAIGHNPAGGFRVLEMNRLYSYNNRLFTLEKQLDFKNAHFGYASVSDKVLAWRNDPAKTSLYSSITNKSIVLPAIGGHTNFAIIDDSHVGISTITGAFIYNLLQPDSVQHFLKDVRICGMLKDTEGNIWFATQGQGVYRLNSAHVLNTRFRDNNANRQALALTRLGQSILVGSDINVIYKLNIVTGTPEKEKLSLTNGTVDPVVALQVNSEKNIIYGTTFGVFLSVGQQKNGKKIRGLTVKSLYMYKGDLFVVSDRHILRVDPLTLATKDTIWNERATTVYAIKDTFYIGTINGLYRRLPNGTKQFLGDRLEPFSYRIAAITSDTNQVLWVATFGGGIVAFKNETILTHLKEECGLTSNICRTLFLHGNSLWVGTNKGLNKIRIDDSTYPVKKYTTGDGLISDIINVLYVEKSRVLVGTPEGITYFDEEKIGSQSRCDLRFVDITIGGQLYYPDQAPVTIQHAKNSLQFNYVGISYKSSGDIRYRYRLLGLDSNWIETRETQLNFPTLPSGDYTLQLQAINKFDVKSQLLVKRFSIEKLLYEKLWFQILIYSLFVAVVAFFAWLIIRRIRKREQEKTATSKRISELEQLSRKAQMNPHFIFNSLNSIQQYVMDADVAGANKFISGFSRLIRQTLDFSSKPEISLEEELDYLTNYLVIERTRLEDTFSWAVNIDDTVYAAEYYIPPMILQPFVENSVRHGLRFRKDKEGEVTITVKRRDDYLVCILEDNGVGRKAAMKYKSISPINYQSKGMSLTADRIEMFNKEHDKKITMQIDDLEDEAQNALGTRVTISFPVM